jgi:hypothetical protein
MTESPGKACRNFGWPSGARLSCCCLLAVIGFVFVLSAVAADSDSPPVAHLAHRAYALRIGEQSVMIPMEMSSDPLVPNPEITRAVIVFHGKGRNVEGYYEALKDAARHGGRGGEKTLLLAPQFLREEDVKAHRLGAEFLRWHLGAWSAGHEATGPLPLSSFDVIDAILANLADRALFPHMDTIVLVGHSGGGQLLNRYAIVGKRAGALEAAGIHVRYVIANPSSYFYFSDERPQSDGSFTPYRAERCRSFNHWRYGPAESPAYVSDTSDEAWRERETAYSGADVVYLLGGEDIDPKQRDLDTSCAAETQGADRLERGRAYYRYLRARHPSDFRQVVWLVPSVAHSGERMIDSPCGVAALFGGTCATDESGAR